MRVATRITIRGLKGCGVSVSGDSRAGPVSFCWGLGLQITSFGFLVFWQLRLRVFGVWDVGSCGLGLTVQSLAFLSSSVASWGAAGHLPPVRDSEYSAPCKPDMSP